jgi:hypothetical protein
MLQVMDAPLLASSRSLVSGPDAVNAPVSEGKFLPYKKF